MTNPTEKVQWLVEFAKKDLAGLRPGARMDLEEDARAFLGFMDGKVSLELLQKEAVKIVADLADSPPIPPDVFVNHRPGFHKKPQPIAALRVNPVEFDIQYVAPGNFLIKPIKPSSITEAFKLCASLYIASLDTLRIRRCPYCKTLFFADHAAQQYDTPKCQNLDATRRFREKRKEGNRRKKNAPKKEGRKNEHQDNDRA